MKFFLASPEMGEIRESLEQGILAGITMDAASLAAAAERSGRLVNDLLGEACALVPGPVFIDLDLDLEADLSADESDAGVRAARELAKLGAQVVVRIPFGAEGLKVIRACVQVGVKVAAASCSTPVEALQAARAGAAWTSPPHAPAAAQTMGPAGARWGESLDAIRKTIGLLRSFDLQTQVLVPLVRDGSALVDVALAGAHAAAMPHAVLQQLLLPDAAKGDRKFMSAWAAAPSVAGKSPAES
jgi:transaldolase